MQYERIIEKAERLGYDTSKIPYNEDKIKSLAIYLGFTNFDINKDLNALEKKLDEKKYEQQYNKRKKKSKDIIKKFKKNNDRLEINTNTYRSHNKFNNTNTSSNNTTFNTSNNRYAKEQNINAKFNDDAMDTYDDATEDADNLDINTNALKENENNVDLANEINGDASKPLNANMNVPKTPQMPSVPIQSATTAGTASGAATGAVGAASASTGAAGAAATGAGAAGAASALAPALPIILIVIGVLFLIIIIVMLIIFIVDYEQEQNTPYIYSCDGISLNQTSMSRDEFVAKVTEYYTNQKTFFANIFIANAGKIYDISKQNNINPELVIIRAKREGYSPSGIHKKYENYNNYWGINCRNESSLDECAQYDSFDDGLLGFINIIKDKASVLDMMSSYSYIGSYWYNKGNSGIGGCYYFPYMQEFMTEEQIARVANACAEGKSCLKGGLGDCVKTTDEDQASYTKYQVSKMIEERETIFGIPADICTSGNCVIYGQNDDRWANIHLGNSNAYMGKHGCAVTSLAIGISCSNTPVTIEDFDAGTFVNALNAGNCFYADGEINWKCPKVNVIAPQVTYGNNIPIGNLTIEEKKNRILSYDPNKSFIILHYNHLDRDGGHFVVYSSIEGDNFIVKDPASGGKISNISISRIDRYIVYNIDRGETENE